MLHTKGIIKISQSTVKVLLNDDFCNYYRYLAGRATWIKFGKPLYEPHISIILPRFRICSLEEWEQYQKYNNKTVELEYDSALYFGGQDRFLGLYARFYSEELRKMFNISGENYFHCTIGTTKNHQNKDFTFWPPQITIL